MAHIVSFLSDMLDEDKYGTDYTNKIMDRLSTFNLKQLDQFYNHLIASETQSKYSFYKTAHEILIECTTKMIHKRLEEQDILDQEEEIKLNKKIKKTKLENQKKREHERVYELIEKKISKQAEDEIRDNEFHRKQEERLIIAKTISEGEMKRSKVIKIASIIIGICIILIGVLVPILVIKLSIIGGLLGIWIIILIRTCHYGQIHPIIMTEDKLLEQIKTRKNELRQEAYNVLEQKEKDFQDKQKQDKLESKLHKQERKIRTIQPRNSQVDILDYLHRRTSNIPIIVVGQEAVMIDTIIPISDEVDNDDDDDDDDIENNSNDNNNSRHGNDVNHNSNDINTIPFNITSISSSKDNSINNDNDGKYDEYSKNIHNDKNTLNNLQDIECGNSNSNGINDSTNITKKIQYEITNRSNSTSSSSSSTHLSSMNSTITRNHIKP